MAITNGYCTLKEYKLRFRKSAIDSVEDDPVLEDVITAVCREIDVLTSRRFYSASETRYYTPEMADRLYVDDLISITTLKTDEDGDRTYENTWTTSDYDLMPLNASLRGEPYSWIDITPNGDYTFPILAKSIELAGSFGWSAVPAQIREASLMGAHRLMKRFDTPLGVSASAAVGEIQIAVTSLRSDPDWMALIEGFIKVVY